MTIKAKITLVKDRITPDADLRSWKLSKLPGQAHKKWVEVTPKRTGNAKRRTKLRGDTIKADYVNARPLDQGRSSPAPEGILKP